MTKTHRVRDQHTKHLPNTLATMATEAASVYLPLEARPVKNTICLFDVDGTLTPARRVNIPLLAFFYKPLSLTTFSLRASPPKCSPSSPPCGTNVPSASSVAPTWQNNKNNLARHPQMSPPCLISALRRTGSRQSDWGRCWRGIAS